MVVKNNQSNEFKKWLAKNNMSYGEFSEKTGIRYTTVVNWARGARPRSIARMILKEKFPDCPLLKESSHQ